MTNSTEVTGQQRTYNLFTVDSIATLGRGPQFLLINIDLKVVEKSVTPLIEDFMQSRDTGPIVHSKWILLPTPAHLIEA